MGRGDVLHTALAGADAGPRGVREPRGGFEAFVYLEGITTGIMGVTADTVEVLFLQQQLASIGGGLHACRER